MKRSFAMRWVKDLLNPRVKQATGMLKNGDGYCCLGRACVVAGLRANWDSLSDSYEYEGEAVSLPSSILAKYDIFSNDGQRRDRGKVVIDGKSYKSLADANDNGVKFKDIAAYIRKNYKQL